MFNRLFERAHALARQLSGRSSKNAADIWPTARNWAWRRELCG